MAKRHSLVPVVDMMLDSGAYSAWTKNDPLSVEEYCDYILANEHWIGPYVSMDVINPNDPEEAARAGMKNYLYMRKRGLTPIPVFHFKERLDWLHAMLSEGADYIGLATTSADSSTQADTWYQLVWNELVTEEGLPIVKVHGFGEARKSVLSTYPWWSSDTSSWIYAMINGKVYIDGALVQHRNDGGATEKMANIRTLEEEAQGKLAEILGTYGIPATIFTDIENKQAHLVAKSVMMYHHYRLLEESINALVPIRYRPSGFFTGRTKQKGITIDKFRLYFAGNGAHIDVAAAVVGMERKLATYYYLRDSEISSRRVIGLATDPLGTCKRDKSLNAYYQPLEDYINESQ